MTVIGLGGKPKKFETPEDLRVVLAEYFEKTPIKEWTITGLALASGCCSRKMLDEYGERPEYRSIVKEAKLKVESSYEVDLKTSGRVGTIFALKNMGWQDKQEIDMNHSGAISLSALAEQRNNPLLEAGEEAEDGEL
jgi:hypothetical protein